MNQESSRANEEDAMFTKKPLGGVSCASCEKNITNLSGHVAEFQAWKLLPFKEPGERISKVGFHAIHFVCSMVLVSLRFCKCYDQRDQLSKHLLKLKCNNTIEGNQ